MIHETPLDPITILLIEDSPGDIELIREGLKQGRVANQLFVAEDGEQAVSFLKQQGAYARDPRPDLVLLDINLPKKNGHEVLRFIREDDQLSSLPVIMLTTSDSDIDIIKGYNQHVNAYITKPVRANDFLAAVRAIEGFWLALVKLPPKAQAA